MQLVLSVHVYDNYNIYCFGMNQHILLSGFNMHYKSLIICSFRWQWGMSPEKSQTVCICNTSMNFKERQVTKSLTI